MQYYVPPESAHYVGDCMPLWHDGAYHLYYLLDENHHRGKGGKGGHRWAHASTRDLVHWEHHPLAIDLGPPGAIDDGSICTGSIFVWQGVHHAFYAARAMSRDGERVCLATSLDGVRFEKHPAQPLLVAPPGYSSRSFRDPCVFHGPDGLFHMLICTCRDEPGLGDAAGCIGHLVSHDLLHWEGRPPFVEGLYGRLDSWEAPECPDYFQWGAYWYVFYGDPQSGCTRYLVSDAWDGPWRSPAPDRLESGMVAVMKTAALGAGRRIGAAFVRSRSGPTDDSGVAYGGNCLLREMVQHEDGSLGTRWPPECVPRPTASAQVAAAAVNLQGPSATAHLADLPRDALLRFRLRPVGSVGDFGLRLRGVSADEPGYELRFRPALRQVTLGRAGRGPSSPHDWCFGVLDHVDALEREAGLDVVLKDDLIDVCVDGRRTLCLRFPEVRGGLVSAFYDGPGEGGVEVETLEAGLL